jgi:hypothetical protein
MLHIRFWKTDCDECNAIANRNEEKTRGIIVAMYKSGYSNGIRSAFNKDSNNVILSSSIETFYSMEGIDTLLNHHEQQGIVQHFYDVNQIPNIKEQ